MSGQLVLDTTPHDVLLGRGNNVNYRPGNRIFRQIAAENSLAYIQADSKKKKDKIARSVVEEVKAKGGRFLRSVTVSLDAGKQREAWEIVCDAIVYTKTKQAMRDLASASNKKENETKGPPPSSAPVSTDDARTSNTAGGVAMNIPWSLKPSVQPSHSLDTMGMGSLDRPWPPMLHQPEQYHHHDRSSAFSGLYGPLGPTVVPLQEQDLFSSIYPSEQQHVLGDPSTTQYLMALHQAQHPPPPNWYPSTSSFDAALHALQARNEIEQQEQRHYIQQQQCLAEIQRGHREIQVTHDRYHSPGRFFPSSLNDDSPQLEHRQGLSSWGRAEEKDNLVGAPKQCPRSTSDEEVKAIWRSKRRNHSKDDHEQPPKRRLLQQRYRSSQITMPSSSLDNDDDETEHASFLPTDRQAAFASESRTSCYDKNQRTGTW